MQTHLCCLKNCEGSVCLQRNQLGEEECDVWSEREKVSPGPWGPLGPGRKLDFYQEGSGEPLKNVEPRSDII